MAASKWIFHSICRYFYSFLPQCKKNRSYFELFLPFERRFYALLRFLTTFMPF